MTRVKEMFAAGMGIAMLGLGMSAPASAEVADADAKKLVEAKCATCHTLVSTYRQRNSRDRWGAIVDDMVARGMEGTDEEIDIIIDYLARHYGVKVRVNAATADELVGGLGIRRSLALRIVSHREKQGSYKSAEDLKKVPNLDWKIIEPLIGQMSFSN